MICCILVGCSGTEDVPEPAPTPDSTSALSDWTGPDIYTHADEFAQLRAIMNKANSSDIMRLGQVFFMNKVSELLMPVEVHEAYGFTEERWDEERFTVHPLALAMMSTGPVVPLATFEPLFQSRFEEFGAVVVPEVFSREFCQELDTVIHTEICECVCAYRGTE